MKIAISGASGLIGTALARSLRLDGHDVLPLVRRAVAPGEQAVQWDPAAGTIDAAALEGIDGLVNLSGAGIGDKRWSDAHKREVLESRTTSTDLLARTIAGLDQPPAVFVSGSAMGIYGDTGDTAVTEQSPVGNDFLAGVCRALGGRRGPGRRSRHPRHPPPHRHRALPATAGPSAKLLPLFKLGIGGRMGSGRQWWSWISLDDEVGALRWLLDHGIRHRSR